MRTMTMWLTVALLIAPAALAAQDSTASTNGGSQARIDAALSTALKAGVPVSLLEGKIAEGKAKHVPMDRIAAAVEQRLDALTEAQAALTKAGITSATDGQLSVAADAVQAGVSQSALVTVSKDASEGSRAVAIAVLTDLVAMGQASEQALTRVQAALSRGPEALANLGADVAGRGQVDAGLVSGAEAHAGAGIGAEVNLGSPKQN
jgi:hypothetical protein